MVSSLVTANPDRVPILTQSEDWALSIHSLLFGVNYVTVPILTQSEDWALLFYWLFF